jgi:TolB-like protein
MRITLTSLTVFREEILTRLAGIADLKVISRTSTQQYQSKLRNLSDCKAAACEHPRGSVQESPIR